MISPNSRIPLFIVIAALAVLAAIGYLILKRDKPEEDFSVQKMIRYPERGLITDRHGKILVGNTVEYDLLVIPEQVTADLDTGRFCQLLGISKQGFERRLRASRRYSNSKISAFEKGIPERRIAAIRKALPGYPGFYGRLRTLRHYPDSVAAHVLGFANRVSPQALKGTFGYSRPGERAGRSGLESIYDSLLRGKTGVSWSRIDSLGRNLGPMDNGSRDIPLVRGKRLRLGIDLDLQKFAEQLLQTKVGSVVAIDPATGEILAYLSSPGYNPNLLSGPKTEENLRDLRKDSLHQLMNRPIRSRNAPGSSLKPVIALIALQQGLIKPTDIFFCPQYYMAGDRRVNCEHFDGRVNLRKGIAQSCNTYFCHLFEKQMASDPAGVAASYTDWRRALALFGLGSTLGVDLPRELGGQIPPTQLFDRRHGAGNWTANDIISLGIGQGELEVTPLQLANIQCILANRGHYFTPHLLRTVAGKKPGRREWTEKHVVPIDAAHFTPVLDGMQDAVETGTALGIRIPGIVFCGKTGTVENTRGKSHSIFAGFAPRDNPKIAIAVVVENAGYGASYAAPIASYLVERYLTGKVSKPAGQVQWMIDQNLLPYR